MSWQPCPSAQTDQPATLPSGIEMEIVPRSRDIGGFDVRRVLPVADRRMVGPFIFFDEMGPAAFAPGNGMDVRPHPHIGLATISYLFDGTILHRDSLGSVQPIRPGDVNWMTAGGGIVHSERSDAELRKAAQSLHGLQLWIALPAQDEEMAPAFDHYPARDLPQEEGDGVTARVIAGTAFGRTSPVRTRSALFYVDMAMTAGARLTLDAEYEERAIYAVSGRLQVAGADVTPGRMLVFAPGKPVDITALEPTRFVLLGGAPMDGPRHIWWNFVSSSTERIEQAKEDWRQNRFNAPIAGETEFIPLPDGI